MHEGGNSSIYPRRTLWSDAAAVWPSYRQNRKLQNHFLIAVLRNRISFLLLSRGLPWRLMRWFLVKAVSDVLFHMAWMRMGAANVCVCCWCLHIHVYGNMHGMEQTQLSLGRVILCDGRSKMAFVRIVHPQLWNSFDSECGPISRARYLMDRYT